MSGGTGDRHQWVEPTEPKRYCDVVHVRRPSAFRLVQEIYAMTLPEADQLIDRLRSSEELEPV